MSSRFSLLRASYYPFFLYRRKRWKENPSERFFFDWSLRDFRNYFTITAEGRNTCLLVLSVARSRKIIFVDSLSSVSGRRLFGVSAWKWFELSAQSVSVSWDTQSFAKIKNFRSRGLISSKPIRCVKKLWGDDTEITFWAIKVFVLIKRDLKEGKRKKSLKVNSEVKKTLFSQQIVEEKRELSRVCWKRIIKH